MPRSFVIAVLALVFIALASLQGSAYAAAGSLDPTFGKGGKVLSNFNHCGLSICNTEPAGALLEADGKIVVAVNSVFGGVVRYLTNGRLDNTFGTAGIVAAVAGIGNANALTAQSDGKFVVAGLAGGSSSDLFTVDRYNSNGTLDTAFGNTTD